MRWLRAVLAEIYGLFVDDGLYAVTIAVWVVVAAIVLPRIDLSGGWGGLILFAGLAGILFESATRRARGL